MTVIFGLALSVEVGRDRGRGGVAVAAVCSTGGLLREMSSTEGMRDLSVLIIRIPLSPV